LYFNNGTNNTALGVQALNNNSTGGSNTAIGVNALLTNNGNNNTAAGLQALNNNSTGSNNTGIGVNALLNNTTGINNTALGFGAGPGVSNNFNTVTIGINSLTTTNNLALLGNTSTIFCGGYANWTNYVSDRRFKKNIKENVPGLDFINALRPVTYSLDLRGLNQFIYKDKTADYEKSMAQSIDEKEKIVVTGFIAQEVEAAAKKTGYDFDGVIIPKDTAQNNYAISYASFVVPLVKAMQEQQALIQKQQLKIELLEKRVAAIEAKL
jgi:hypothetical protein